jgi:hypothetical protein
LPPFTSVRQGNRIEGDLAATVYAARSLEADGIAQQCGPVAGRRGNGLRPFHQRRVVPSTVEAESGGRQFGPDGSAEDVREGERPTQELAGLLLLTSFCWSVARVRTAPGDSVAGAADIVYSTRYYWPGARPSHYKIYVVDVAGAGRGQLTFGEEDDGSPLWLDDETIRFVRDDGKCRSLSTVKVGGGPVTELTVLPTGGAAI